MAPVVVLRASTGSPASPPIPDGSEPRSDHVSPPSLDRAVPVNLGAPPEFDPASLNAPNPVEPNTKNELSLRVKLLVPVAPTLLLMITSACAVRRPDAIRSATPVSNTPRANR